jgi:hypothetical protein
MRFKRYALTAVWLIAIALGAILISLGQPILGLVLGTFIGTVGGYFIGIM